MVSFPSRDSQQAGKAGSGGGGAREGEWGTARANHDQSPCANPHSRMHSPLPSRSICAKPLPEDLGDEILHFNPHPPA